MTTLHKFKLLASQCAVVAGSPTQSPTTSPVIHLRRRKTLRMLLSRSSHDYRRRLPRRDDLPPKDPPQKKRVRKKLKDLFVSSPPFEDKGEHHDPDVDRDEEDLLPDAGRGSTGGSGPRIGGLTPRRPISGTFRHRLLRRSWRPVLVSIPE